MTRIRAPRPLTGMDMLLGLIGWRMRVRLLRVVGKMLLLMLLLLCLLLLLLLILLLLLLEELLLLLKRVHRGLRCRIRAEAGPGGSVQLRRHAAELLEQLHRRELRQLVPSRLEGGAVRVGNAEPGGHAAR